MLFRVEPLGDMTREDVSPSYFAPQPSLSGSRIPYYVSTTIPICQINFYQNSIATTFSNGRSLKDTIAFLEEQGIQALQDIPSIEALHWRGKWYGMGNRRLACYHYVYRDHPETLIPVKALFLSDSELLNPQGDGTSVRLGHPLKLPPKCSGNNNNVSIFDDDLWHLSMCRSRR
eukprot:PhF_6_TR40337/c1_g4_i1/m.59985